MATQIAETACISRIKSNAARDDIDLNVLPFLQIALRDIVDISKPISTPEPSSANRTRIDTHVHPIPSWFRDLQPLAAGRETPTWNVSSHLEFMVEQGIKRSILCISTPQANAFPGDKEKTIALARLLNEFNAELARIFPEWFSWLAVTPLPYVAESVREVKYALEELGAVGVGVLTNHEGFYPGDEKFDELWEYLQGKRSEKEIVFIHPTDPMIRLNNGELINSKPCRETILHVDQIQFGS
jgi:6-methylsalicylate decarboxylase